ncbi:unnamed protein product [Polarella glacialis]|uniref:Uncharacterized protein n=1 Tax=Polarella glacialis TaxID=89957 RepID=A0A813FR93_POLGL|nr:unnamed protein product [Polarella glacialis]
MAEGEAEAAGAEGLKPLEKKRLLQGAQVPPATPEPLRPVPEPRKEPAAAVLEQEHHPDGPEDDEEEEEKPKAGKGWQERLRRSCSSCLLLGRSVAQSSCSNSAALNARLDRLESWLERRQERQRREVVLAELRRLAAAKGDLPNPGLGCCRRRGALTEEEEKFDFTATEVTEAFRRAHRRCNSPSLIEVLQGQATWRQALSGGLLGRLFQALLVALVVHCALGAIAFSVSRGFAVKHSGALEPSSWLASAPPAAAATTVTLRPLWRFPELSLEELRQVEDVMFIHDHASHTLRIAHVTRSAAGAVLVEAADGSTIRVEPGGRSFWGQRGWTQEVYLTAMEAMQSFPGANSGGTVDWLIAGALGTDLLVPG